MEKIYVVGGAQTDFKRNWLKEGKDFIDMLKETVKSTLEQAGLTRDEVIALNKENKIACFVGNFIGEKYINQGHLGALLTQVDSMFYGMPSARYEAACASGSVALDAAMAKLHAGDYEVALVFGFEMMKTVSPKVGGDFLGHAAFYSSEAKDIEFPFPKLFARLADETIAKYSIDETRYLNALADISVKNYANGKRNPNAQTREWEMSSEKARARGSESNMIIGGKLAISDCSQITDGAVGVVLVS
ncbi:MAG: beta-ketoacyl synthase N-terminal-like domain-containing protein, partial [Oscillospiraceae bacterium]